MFMGGMMCHVFYTIPHHGSLAARASLAPGFEVPKIAEITGEEPTSAGFPGFPIPGTCCKEIVVQPLANFISLFHVWLRFLE